MENHNTFNYYNYLGFFNPFYKFECNKLTIDSNIANLTNTYSSLELDITSIIELLNRNYILGNRTIFKHIYRTPWMAKPSKELTGWEFYKLPNHYEIKMSENEIAEELFKRLKNELLSYIGNKKNIGILLSGGMDSRIIAGTLDFLIKSGELQNISVTALTWGEEHSRDVVYSKLIAKKLKWEWKHFKVDADALIKNIEIAAQRGCEYSPIHLHAMPQIKNEPGLDCIIAGSFGDSIGRGVYSSKHLLNLKDLRAGITNSGRLLKNNIYQENKIYIDEDIKSYHLRFPQKKEYQQIEQDYQLHYMRRMLNPCMSVINDNIPVFQMFSSPEVYEFMWTIHPSLRNNNIYKIILKLFLTDISDIPWAKTGTVYEDNISKPDNFLKKHHRYKEIINSEIYETIASSVLSNNIENLGIFNIASIEKILKLIKRNYLPNSLFYEEKIIWFASLSKMIDLYHIKSDNHKSNAAKYHQTIMDKYKLNKELYFKIFKEKMKNIIKA